MQQKSFRFNLIPNNEAIANEIRILKSLSHPNIIKIIEDFKIFTEEEGFVVIILEYCENGSLLDYLIEHQNMGESAKKKIVRELLQGMKYLHELGISHGDFKVENIVLDSQLNPKICDFRNARKKRFAGDESKCGSLFYAAPELFFRNIKFDTLKSDIYAIGIAIYAIFELSFPYSEENTDTIINEIIFGKLKTRKNMDEGLLSLFKKCTEYNPERRPDIDDVLNDEFIFDTNISETNENPFFTYERPM